LGGDCIFFEINIKIAAAARPLYDKESGYYVGICLDKNYPFMISPG
jgi:hypothetical protein